MEQHFTELFKYGNKSLQFILKDNTCVEISKSNYKNKELEKEWLPCKCKAGHVLLCAYDCSSCSCSDFTYIKVLERTHKKGILAFSYSNLYIRYIAQSIQRKNEG